MTLTDKEAETEKGIRKIQQKKERVRFRYFKFTSKLNYQLIKYSNIFLSFIINFWCQNPFIF